MSDRKWSEGRYRWRTRLRVRILFALLWLAPKGSGDCGNHEWYDVDNVIEGCYHCVAFRPRPPDAA